MNRIGADWLILSNLRSKEGEERALALIEQPDKAKRYIYHRVLLVKVVELFTLN